MNLPPQLEAVRAVFSTFSRREALRLKYGAVAIAAISGLMYWQIDRMETRYASVNQEITNTPDAPPDESNGHVISKAEGAALEKKLNKYKGIKNKLESFFPKEGQAKPAIITINDIVQKIPGSIEVDKSERTEDTAMMFSEQLLTGFIDVKNPKPVYKFQSLMYNLAFRSTYTALVQLLKQFDQIGTYYFVRELHIHPTTEGQLNVTGQDPKFSVELGLETIYLLKTPIPPPGH